MSFKRLLQLPRGFLVVGFTSALFVAACTAQDKAAGQVETSSHDSEHWTKVSDVPISEGVYKVVDLESGNVCYYVISGRAYSSGPNGISCVPEAQVPVVE